MEAVTIGLDIAKSVFQAHGVDAAGEVVFRRRLTRSRLLDFFDKQPRCLVGIEACASAHYWARELTGLGHTVRLIPPSYVKAYLKRQKNDAADAEAICEAVTRPSMRFVPVKSVEQQDIMVVHRTRSLLMRQRVQLSNAIRAQMSEFGVVAPVGRSGLDQLIAIAADGEDSRIPDAARASLLMLAEQLRMVNGHVLQNDRRIIAAAPSSDVGRRLMEVPGVGPVLASALVAGVLDRFQKKWSPVFRPKAV
jgi:transposase